MTGKDLFEIWAPSESVWSQWVSPVLFAQIHCPENGPAQSGINRLSPRAQMTASDDAIVVDLPGGAAIKTGLDLAEQGYRPIPVINASPGPFSLGMSVLGQSSNLSSQSVILDMSELVREVCIGTPRLQQLRFSADARPVFILDSRRLRGTQSARENMFDNRWMVFPQDFPSARFLSEQGIKRVIVIQEKKAQPQEDLAHVLLRWQQAGLEISVSAEGSSGKMTITAPSRFKASWYRALAIMGLRRNSAGGFGSVIPSASAG